MHLRKLLCVGVALSLLLSCTYVVHAEKTFSTPKELIEETINTALTGVTSSTLDDAVNYILDNISTSDDEVLYNGATLGYWYSSKLYADTAKEHLAVSSSNKASVYVLSTLLSDINDHLTETVVPTSSDWSKIIGKYDVIFDDFTIPSTDWIKLSEGESADISTEFSYYAIDSNGELYVQNSRETDAAVMPSLDTISFVSIDNFSIALIDISTIVEAGIVAVENDFTVSPTASQTIVGNTLLEKRLQSLPADGLITLSSTGWAAETSVTPTSSETITLTTPGESAAISSTIDFEEMNFKVIVPANLPMTADTNGHITTADNAVIINQSSAPVKITGLTITENPSSGWKLVNSSPSETRGANEFTFNTSLSVGDTIAKGKELPFTYSAKISPVADGTNAVDLVTVTLTIDWED